MSQIFTSKTQLINSRHQRKHATQLKHLSKRLKINYTPQKQSNYKRNRSFERPEQKR